MKKIILSALLLAIIVTNLLLVKQNFSLRSKIFPDYSSIDLPQEGDRLGSFVAGHMRGGTVKIEYGADQPRRVFLFFSPQCRFSHVQFPYWKELLGERQDLEIYGVVSDSEDMLRVAGLLRSLKMADLPVLLVSEENRQKYQFSITPMTLVVEGDGRVSHVWVGRWGYEALQEATHLVASK